MAGMQGMTALKKQLRAIRSGNQNASRTAALAGARHLRQQARAAAPRASGQGAKAIIARRERGRPGEGVATVGITRAGFYLQILEVGARAHAIAVKTSHSVVDPRSRKTLRKEKGRRALALGKGFGAGQGLLVFRRAVQHPGVPARPWFRPTYTREKDTIIRIIGEAYTANMKKQAQKKGL